MCPYRSDATPEAYFQCSIIFTLIGAWLGAFPIPLDWDRPWQVRQGGDWGHIFYMCTQRCQPLKICCLILDHFNHPMPHPPQNPLPHPTPLNLLIDHFLGLRPSLPPQAESLKWTHVNQDRVKFHKNTNHP